MPNAGDGYRKRQEEHELREKARKQALENDRPYNPKGMVSKIPLGCSMGLIVLVIIICAIFVKVLRLLVWG